MIGIESEFYFTKWEWEAPIHSWVSQSVHMHCVINVIVCKGFTIDK